ncbi:hypothetical protein BDA99DRAFT_558329 [Phascolomyces articulosus]|uniref:Uncharacterized protein n=1 Tax=Phascolomyces articulosus TaxID=60185 RepID=A0AAD5KD42_9FUNG|nr:hypothetical protein BDA99DRAFT_558329 [Phascolomyces articulosus]
MRRNNSKLVSPQCSKINDAKMTVASLTNQNALKFFDMYGDTLSRVIIIMESYMAMKPVRNAPPDAFLRHCPNMMQFTFDAGIQNPTEYRPSTLLADFQH